MGCCRSSQSPWRFVCFQWSSTSRPVFAPGFCLPAARQVPASLLSASCLNSHFKLFLLLTTTNCLPSPFLFTLFFSSTHGPLTTRPPLLSQHPLSSTYLPDSFCSLFPFVYRHDLASRWCRHNGRWLFCASAPRVVLLQCRRRRLKTRVRRRYEISQSLVSCKLNCCRLFCLAHHIGVCLAWHVIFHSARTYSSRLQGGKLMVLQALALLARLPHIICSDLQKKKTLQSMSPSLRSRIASAAAHSLSTHTTTLHSPSSSERPSLSAPIISSTMLHSALSCRWRSLRRLILET